MNIEKIPGYEKTPHKIKRAKDAMRIFEIAGLKVDITDNHLFANAATLKKILDDRRLLLQCLLLHEISIDELSPYTDDQLKKLNKVYIELTGKTFHELLKVINE